jgi:hypothetical protein
MSGSDGSVDGSPNSEPLVTADLIALNPHGTPRAHRGCCASLVWIFAKEHARGFIVAASGSYALPGEVDEASGEGVAGLSGRGGHGLGVVAPSSAWTQARKSRQLLLGQVFQGSRT